MSGVFKVRPVFASNIREAFAEISQIIKTHPVVALDTEFPGVAIDQSVSFSKFDYITKNANRLKMIQLGLTFANHQGQLSTPSTYQFNFAFDLRRDEIIPDVKELLTTAGVPFSRMVSEGIAPEIFAYYFAASGLLANPTVTWVAFHGNFDFAYLLRSTNPAFTLPDNTTDYENLVKAVYPRIIDMRVVAVGERGMESGLEALYNYFNMPARAAAHQACSDSYATIATFFACVDRWFNGNMSGLDKYLGKIWES